jgi:hypothetical protein
MHPSGLWRCLRVRRRDHQQPISSDVVDRCSASELGNGRPEVPGPCLPPLAPHVVAVVVVMVVLVAVLVWRGYDVSRATVTVVATALTICAAAVEVVRRLTAAPVYRPAGQ